MVIQYDNWKMVPATFSAWPWQHFTPKEMCCRGTGKLKLESRLLDCLDILRDRFGGPLRVLSAYRSPYHNARVGGAPMSRHLIGDAVDLSIVNQDKLLLKKLAKDVGFTGFGYYRTFLHIDLGRKREWGKGKWNA